MGFTSQRLDGAHHANHITRIIPAHADEEVLMGLMRFMFAICVWAMVPFDARGGIRDLEDEAATRIAKRFVMMAGSPENAVALALALRNGGMVMLVHDEGGWAIPKTHVFELPARTLDWDDVRICLALAQDTLIRQGVLRPKPEQLEATLIHVLDSMADGVEWKDPAVRVRARAAE
jgi:hypothetical protein